MLQRLILCVLLFGLFSGLADAQKISARDLYEGFKRAVEADDYLSQKTLVTENKAHVQSVYFGYEFNWCSALNAGDQERADQTLKVMDAFAYVNKLENNDGYWVRRLAWAKALTPEQRQARTAANTAFDKAYGLYDAAKKSKGGKTEVDAAMVAFDDVVKSSAAASDDFWLYNAYYYQGELQSMVPNYFDAVYYYAQAQKAVNEGKLEQFAGSLGGRLVDVAKIGKIKHELIPLDVPLEESRTKYAEAVAAAASAPGGGSGAGGAGGMVVPKDAPPRPAPTEPVEWVDAKPFKQKPLPGGLGIPTPYMADVSHWFFWPGVLIPDGKEVELSFLPGDVKVGSDSGKVFVKRPGKTKEINERLKIGAKAKLHAFPDVAYLDGTTSTVAHMLMTSPSRYTFNGFALSSSGKDVFLRFRGATSVSGELRGHDVTLFDSNGNGTFNTDIDFGRDSIVVGKGKNRTVQPLSSVVNLGGQLYSLKMATAAGTQLITKPYDEPLALLKVDFVSKHKPEFLIARGLNNIYIDLMQGVDKPMWVPVGPYEFFSGYMVEGMGERAKTLEIVGGSGQFKVAEGQLNVWQLGGAGDGFYFDVKSSVVKENGLSYVVIKGEDVKVRGCFGEEYRNSMLGVPTPKVWMRQGKDGTIWLNGEEMRKPERSELDVTVMGMFWPKPLKVKMGAPGEFSIKMEGVFPPLGKVATKGWIPGGE